MWERPGKNEARAPLQLKMPSQAGLTLRVLVDGKEQAEIKHEETKRIHVEMPLYSAASRYMVDFEEPTGETQKWPVCPYEILVSNTSTHPGWADLFIGKIDPECAFTPF